MLHASAVAPSAPRAGTSLTLAADGAYVLEVRPRDADAARAAGFAGAPGATRLTTRDPHAARRFRRRADRAAEAALAARFGDAAITVPAAGPYLTLDRGRLALVLAPGDRRREMLDRVAAAGFVYDAAARVWTTESVAAATALDGVPASSELASVIERLRRPKSIFDEVVHVGIDDLMRIVAAPRRGGGGGEAATPEAATILTHDRAAGLFVCADPLTAHACGFLFDGVRWTTADPDTALTLRDRADDAAEVALQDHLLARALPVTPFTDAIPAPPGRTYYGFQDAGVRFLAERRCGVLGDEMGLGKTIEAFGLVNTLPPGPAAVLMVVPAALRRNALREGTVWLTGGRTVAIARPGRPVPAADVVITSYGGLVRNHALRARTWDLALFDEAQNLKNEASQRSNAVFGAHGVRAARWVWMSGTIIHNRPQDLWPILHATAPRAFPSKERFYSMYAIRDLEADPEAKRSNLEDLGAMLRRRLMIRRMTEDVLGELPPLWKVPVEVDLEATTGRALVEAEHELLHRLRLARSGRLPAVTRFEVLAELQRLRLLVGRAKAPRVVERARQLLGAGEPVVVFVHHREVAAAVLEALRADGWRVEPMTGGETPARRQRTVDRFQAGLLDAVVATTGASGVGYTMTRAAHVLAGEIDWNPSVVDQMLKRCHRIGQTREVLVEFFVIPGTVDARIAAALSSKADFTALALGDLPALPDAEAACAVPGQGQPVSDEGEAGEGAGADGGNEGVALAA